jgi:hypothetical protein
MASALRLGLGGLHVLLAVVVLASLVVAPDMTLPLIVVGAVIAIVATLLV